MKNKQPIWKETCCNVPMIKFETVKPSSKLEIDIVFFQHRKWLRVLCRQTDLKGIETRNHFLLDAKSACEVTKYFNKIVEIK